MQGREVFLSVVTHRWIRVCVTKWYPNSVMVEAATMKFLVLTYTSDPVFTFLLLFLSQIIN